MAHPAVRVELADGQIVQQNGVGSQRIGPLLVRLAEIAPSHWRALLRNEGAPEWRSGAREATPARVLIRRAGLGVPPGWTIEWAAERGATPAGWSSDGLDAWTVIDSADRRHLLADATDLGSPWLQGGETVWWDIIGAGRTPPAIDPAIKARLHPLLYMIPGLPVPVRVDRLRSLYRIAPGSLQWDGVADLGWWLRWARKRHTQGRLPDALGWMEWGAVDWSDGWSNHNYDPARHALSLYLRTGDAGAWALARLLAEQQVRSGFIWTASGDPMQAHRWRYEKSSFAGKVGDDRWAEASHEWDTGCLAVAHASGDPDLLEAMRLRGEQLLRMAAGDVWRRYWGVRFAAWHLESLRAFYLLTGDARFRQSAETKLRAWFGMLKPDETHWPEDGDPGLWYPWMDAIMATQAAWWFSAGAAPECVPRLWDMTQRLLSDGCRFRTLSGAEYLEVGYEAGTRNLWQSPPLTAFLLPVTWVASQGDARFKRHHAAARRTVCDLLFQAWADAGKPLAPGEDSFRGGAYGYGTPKAFGCWAYALTADQWLQ